MKALGFKIAVVVGLLLLWGPGAIGVAEPMGAGFAYQGRLTEGGQPAEGSYDFQFKLFDAPAAGTQQGGTLDVNAVEVIEGCFAVELDFISGGSSMAEPGPQPMGLSYDKIYGLTYGKIYGSGDARWLEIAVRRSGGPVQALAVEAAASAPYTVLLPRQKLTPVPYALYALNGGGAPGSLAPPDSGGLYDVLRWSSSWDLPAGETAKPVGDAGGQNLFNVGQLGIGPYLPDPAERLDLSWTGGVNARIGRYNYLGSCFSSATFVLGNNARARTDTVNGVVVGQPHDSYGYRAITMGSDGIVFHTLAGKVTPGDAVASERVRITNDGRVGIGTTTPNAKLEVAGTIRTSGPGDGAWTNMWWDKRLVMPSASAIQWLKGEGYTISRGIGFSQDKLCFIRCGAEDTSGQATYDMVVDKDGNVGIGTATPQTPFQVVSQMNTFAAFPTPGRDIGYGTQGIGLNLLRKSTGEWQTPVKNVGAAIYADCLGMNFVIAGSGVPSEPQTFTDSQIANERVMMRIRKDGRVGIGCLPSATLEVGGNVRIRTVNRGDGVLVCIDGNGELFRMSSSQRYKTNVRDLQDDPEKILDLRPVRFQWTSTGQEDIGLIAEEVAESMPDLVICDKEGKPDAVKYERMSLYLLSVVKAQQQRITELEATQAANASLTQRIESLEQMVRQQRVVAKEVQP